MPATAQTSPQVSADNAQEQRQKYIEAFNGTMIQIWQERITLLDVIDTGNLLRSPLSLPIHADGRFFEISLSQQFIEYGLWQDYGVGRETPRGNSGDIGRAKVRKRRPWFSKKYYASVMNLRDFLADNIGHEFQGIIADTFARTNKIY